MAKKSGSLESLHKSLSSLTKSIIETLYKILPALRLSIKSSET